MDRVIRGRLDELMERLGARAPTQCGFRTAHGCLDAVFILQHLINKVPGAGPIVGDVCVPDLMYADDVCLISASQQQAQALLNCLDLFCKLFAMEVNLSKTFAVVFRPSRGHASNVPAGARLTYRDIDICFRDSFKYLGVLFSAKAGLAPAADMLAESGRHAMYALSPLLRQSHISQFDMRCRMFDVLVEPVLSYASHIWGPDMFAKWLQPRRDARSSAADHVHFQFLRYMLGVGKHVHKEVILREFHRMSMPSRWLLLAASWWEKLRCMSDDRLARQAWVADIELMLSGCTACWTYRLLSAFEGISLLPASQWRRGSPGVTPASVQLLVFDRPRVHDALLRTQREHWSALVGHDVDPRTGPPGGTHMRTHASWVHKLADGVVQTRHNAPKYMKLFIPMSRLQCLARYRLGGQHLVGRRAGRTDRGMRPCPLCSCTSSDVLWNARMLARCNTGRDEDLLHFMLECPAYDHIRENFPSLFAHTREEPATDRMLHVFHHEDQARVAECVWHMDLYRASLLGLPRPPDARVRRQPDDYIPADPALRCAADNVPPPTRGLHTWPLLGLTGSIILLAALLRGCWLVFGSILDVRACRAL